MAPRRVAAAQSPDAPKGPTGKRSGKIRENHDQRQGGVLSARPGEPGLQGPGAQRAPGLWLHLRRHLTRLRLSAPRQGHSDQWRSHGAIINDYVRKIVGWRVSLTGEASPRHRPRINGSRLDAREQAIHARRPAGATD